MAFRFAGILFLLLLATSIVAQDIDYTSNENWWARPDMNDFADHVPMGPFYDRQDSAKADVFFIHPTTYYRGLSANASLKNQTSSRLTNVVLLNQATVFNGSCRVFAPKYRQTILKEFMLKDDTGRVSYFDIAYSDIRIAFETYLKEFNNGRPVVIAGHSQGSYLAQRLLADYFENKPLYDQLVVAYIPGYPLPESNFGTLYKQIKTCNIPNETGCIATWQTMNYEGTFRFNDRLDGRLLVYTSSGHRFLTADDSLACTNPLSWRSDQVTIPTDSNPGSLISVTRPGHMPEPKKEVCDATVWKGKAVVTELKDLSFNSTGGNYHIHDYGLFWVSIRRNVAYRIENHLSVSD